MDVKIRLSDSAVLKKLCEQFCLGRLGNLRKLSKGASLKLEVKRLEQLNLKSG